MSNIKKSICRKRFILVPRCDRFKFYRGHIFLMNIYKFTEITFLKLIQYKPMNIAVGSWLTVSIKFLSSYIDISTNF